VSNRTSVRLAIVNDIHSAPPDRPNGFWNGPMRYDRALPRLDAALEWLTGSDPDVLLVLGDLTEDGDDESLLPVLERVENVAPLPTIVLGGNHDGALLDRLKVPPAQESAGVTLMAPELRAEGEMRFSAHLDELPDEGLVVVVTHFPFVSREAAFAERELKYAGDLVNGGEIAHRLLAREAPTVVITAHLHAGDVFTEGGLLQIVLPPLVEGEGAASLVDVAAQPAPEVTFAIRTLDGPGLAEGHATFAGGRWRT
jgi:hypothetical protein